MTYRLMSVCLILFFSSAFAETLYVNSEKASLLSSPAFNSPPVAVMRKGDALTLLETQQRWLKVAFDTHQGWVSALLVKTHPPLEKVNLIGSDKYTLEGDARRRASAVATAGATRGLTEGDDLTGMQSDYQELLTMESLVVPEDKLATFAYEISEAQP